MPNEHGKLTKEDAIKMGIVNETEAPNESEQRLAARISSLESNLEKARESSLIESLEALEAWLWNIPGGIDPLHTGHDPHGIVCMAKGRIDGLNKEIGRLKGRLGVFEVWLKAQNSNSDLWDSMNHAAQMEILLDGLA